jgi:hypothetical protein
MAYVVMPPIIADYANKPAWLLLYAGIPAIIYIGVQLYDAHKFQVYLKDKKRREK